ncbi:NUDIX hydrolase [Levilactobacillus bambusae]|uniref:ADP-ribose pyrophosphatase n=1 Tax=Levilactobacillus bambusae TaxID=2024736 RepID=A0A2V1N124_9LACO|nr:NUDIX hydrolase [Levilactobacillus bambusae]PWG00782.1 ADP-ribose pyrophosphatase [Levilactobacillus bambusae]
MADYIKSIRKLVGHQPIILNTATGAVFNDDHQILLQERADTGGWGLPGGFLEFGESFEQACQREIKEDTGLEVVPVRNLGIFDQYFYTYPNGDELQNISVLFLCRITGGRLLEHATAETSSLQFFDLSKTPTLFMQQSQDMLEILISLSERAPLDEQSKK